MISAYFYFTFDSEKEARVVVNSLQPEIKHKIPKTNIHFKLDDKSFSLKIETNDLSSLRAACNSYLRWINTAISVNKTV